MSCIARTHRVLQFVNGLGIEEMVFAVAPPLILTANVQRIDRHIAFRIRACMSRQSLRGDDVETHAFNARRSAGEIFVDDFAVQSHRFKNLCAAIAVNGADAHLGHHFDDAFFHGLVVILNARFVIDFRQQTIAQHVVERFKRQIRIDRAGTVAISSAK